MSHSPLLRAATATTLILALTTSALPAHAEVSGAPAPAAAPTPAAAPAPAPAPADKYDSADKDTEMRGRPLWPVAVGSVATIVFFGLGVHFIGQANDNSTAAGLTEAGLAEKGVTCGKNATGLDAVACTNIEALRSEESKLRPIAIASFVGAGVAVAATAVYLLWPSSSASEEPKKTGPSARAIPLVSPSSAGLGVVGTF